MKAKYECYISGYSSNVGHITHTLKGKTLKEVKERLGKFQAKYADCNLTWVVYSRNPFRIELL